MRSHNDECNCLACEHDYLQHLPDDEIVVESVDENEDVDPDYVPSQG